MKNTNYNNIEEELVQDINLTDATPVEVQSKSSVFFNNLGEGVKFLTPYKDIDDLLKANGYTEKEAENFVVGLKCLLSKTFVRISKADMTAYTNNTYAKIQFVSSILKLVPLKIIPNINTYYIAPRKILNKKTGEVHFDFKIELQYQAKIDALENKGVNIVRIDYILANEWNDNLQDISTGELIITHKPNLIERKGLINGSAITKGDIVGAYVVYQQNSKIKYFMIDYERIHKAYKASEKQNSHGINWGGTGGDGAKKTAVHRLFDYIINKNIEDNEPISEFVSFTESNTKTTKERKIVLEDDILCNTSSSTKTTHIEKEEIEGLQDVIKPKSEISEESQLEL